MKTFSIGFKEQSFDELANARLVAKRYDTDHHELVLEPDAASLLPAFARIFDEPFADSAALRPTSSRSSPPSTSRSSSRARVATNSSAATTPTLPTCSLLASHRPGPCSSRSRAPSRPPPTASASTTRPSASPVGSACRRSSAITRGREIFSAEARAELLGRSDGAPGCRQARDERRCGSRHRPTGLPARALRRDRGVRRALASSGRRPRRPHGRRPIDAHRSREHGPLSRGACSLPRPARLLVCVRATPAAQGQGLQEEAPAPRGGRSARPTRDRARRETGLLDSGGALATRRARALRARGALRRDRAAAWVLRRKGRYARPRQPRERPS